MERRPITIEGRKVDPPPAGANPRQVYDFFLLGLAPLSAGEIRDCSPAGRRLHPFVPASIRFQRGRSAAVHAAALVAPVVQK